MTKLLARPLRYTLLCVLMLLALPLRAEENAPASSDYVNYIELKPFVTNFGTAQQVRFLKAEVTIQVSSPAAHHAVNAHMPQIRNDLVFLFSDSAEAELEGVAAQQKLAGEALKRVQEILVAEEGEAFVSDLFFTSFVTQ